MPNRGLMFVVAIMTVAIAGLLYANSTGARLFDLRADVPTEESKLAECKADLLRVRAQAFGDKPLNAAAKRNLAEMTIEDCARGLTTIAVVMAARRKMIESVKAAAKAD